jgi:hypothetical protein
MLGWIVSIVSREAKALFPEFSQQLVNKLQKISSQFIGIIPAAFYSEFNLTF